MENYKVKVGSEAESKEAQELFFELGYKWIDIGAVYYKISTSFNYITAYCEWKTLAQGHGLDAKKELAIPQLRDMVVLKRNDVSDATHSTESCGAKGFLSSDGVEYFWEYGVNVWSKHGQSNFAEYEMKPITKEPIMKEFLNPDQGYGLVRCAIGETPIPKDWIEVPEGADKATLCGGYLIYWKGNNLSFSVSEDAVWRDANNYPDRYYQFDEYLNEYQENSVIWQRETLNDKVASAEVARQSGMFVSAPFDDLPEFNFKAVDVVDAEFFPDNVNQPSHYCSHPSGIECIEITRHHDFTIGNAIKYLWRAGLKDSANEIQDLEKASWYIQDKINQLKKLNENSSKD